MLSDAQRLALVYDAHSHIHLDSSEVGVTEMRTVLAKLGGAALMSTGDDDWEAAVAAASASPNTRCLLGVHPWFAHRYAEDQAWVAELRDRLMRTPGSGVGEIGLDKQWRTPDTGQVEYAAQLEVFHAQLALAAELALPVSVHCVHAQGDIYQALASASTLPPTIYLHAFGGAAGTVEQLTRSRGFGDRLYFGFAACINLRSSKSRAAIAAVPDDRLVIESDRSSAARQGVIEGELLKMLEIYTEIKGWSTVEDTIKRTAHNAERLYAPADVPRTRGLQTVISDEIRGKRDKLRP